MAEEQIDVYEWDGTWTGQTLPKSEVHAQGLVHACTHGVITDGRERIITQYRGPNVKLMRNVWDVVSVAGHISALTNAERQNPANWDLIWQARRALVREAGEEIGQTPPMDMPFSDRCIMFGVTRTDQETEDRWWDRTLSYNFMLLWPDFDLATVKLEEGKVLDARWTDVGDIERWLRGQVGGPFATRNPDNYQLLQGIVDCARRF